MKPAPFTYHAPTSVDEAVVLLAKWRPQDGRILAGGQSLVPTMALRMAPPPHLIDINGIAELARMAVIDGVLKIGACVRHAARYRCTAGGGRRTATKGRALYRALSERAGRFAAVSPMPIRRRNGVVLWRRWAESWCCAVVAVSVAFTPTSFFRGMMTAALEEDELIVAAELPLLRDGTPTGFEELLQSMAKTTT
jgi:aerobic carbon-monoxide dehydrogenase medium subunit